jgi:hypothetical protein
MSSTLADVYMITDLKVTGTVYPYKYKGSSKQTRVKTGVGYKRYIQNHISDGPLTDVEYRAFLNMWLCRFIFCARANEPTLNHIVMAEDLAAGTPIPLGKYLLGIVYHMLHPLCLKLMPDFQPTSDVICSSPFLTSVFNHTPPD